jgi:hypothetical protein
MRNERSDRLCGFADTLSALDKIIHSRKIALPAGGGANVELNERTVVRQDKSNSVKKRKLLPSVQQLNGFRHSLFKKD